MANLDRILVVDNEPGALSVVTTLLKAEGYQVTPLRESQKALELVKSNEEFELMVFDIRMSPIDGMELLKSAREWRPTVSVIMLTAYGTVETAIEALKLGAFDYVTKPYKVEELLITVQRALEYTRTLQENIDLKAQLGSRYEYDNIICESPAMRNVCDMIERVAPTDATVLIYGESGTGKELVAKAIHEHSHRKGQRFVAVNCAALPEPLLESEMFGHVKGAFTGASSNKAGLFEVADGGTIFMDEIGGMPINIQGKLLRVLQEKEIRRVGGSEDIPVNTRVLAATNMRLEDLIKRGTFREDLYYRLSVIPIEIKPLRERSQDILPLAYHLLRSGLAQGARMPSIDSEVRDMLIRYNWPGNVRELENAMKHAVTFATGDVITRDVLPARLLDVMASMPAGFPLKPGEPFHCKALKTYLRDREKEYVVQVLSHFDGDKAKAAEALQVSLATLYRKLPESYR